MQEAPVETLSTTRIRSAMSRFILRTLAEEPNGLTAEELAERVGEERKNMSRRLFNLRGYVTHSAHCRNSSNSGRPCFVWRLLPNVTLVDIDADSAVPDGTPGRITISSDTASIEDRRALVKLLSQHAAGLTTAQISQLSGKPVEMIAPRLKELAMEYDVLSISDGVWVVSEEGVRSYLDTRRLAKTRLCLGCSKPFQSQHAGNRLCAECSAETAAISGFMANAA